MGILERGPSVGSQVAALSSDAMMLHSNARPCNTLVKTLYDIPGIVLVNMHGVSTPKQAMHHLEQQMA